MEDFNFKYSVGYVRGQVNANANRLQLGILNCSLECFSTANENETQLDIYVCFG